MLRHYGGGQPCSWPGHWDKVALTAVPKAGVQQACNKILSPRKERSCSKNMDMEPDVVCVAKAAGWTAPGHCGTPHQALSQQQKHRHKSQFQQTPLAKCGTT